MATARELLSEAFDAAETSGELHTPEPSTSAPPPEPASDPAPAATTAKPAEGTTTRDEAGRFARPTLKLPQKGEPNEYRKAWDLKLRQGEEPPKFDLAKRPASWRPEMEQYYATLPAHVRDYLHLRDWESERGIAPLKQQAQRLTAWEQAMGPVLEQLQRNGVAPDAFLRDIANTVSALASPQVPMENKRVILNRIATQYGVEVAQQASQQATAQASKPALPPEVAPLAQRLERLEGSIRQREEQREAEEWEVARQAVTEVASNREKYPHFEKVRVSMGRLIDSGEATSPQDAYHKAVRLNDELFAAEQAAKAEAERAKKEQEAAATAAAARRAAVSPKSSTPGAAANSKSTPKDRREAISQAWDDVHNGVGRV